MFDTHVLYVIYKVYTYVIQYTVYTIHYPLYSIHYIYYTIYIGQGVYIVYCIVYSVYCVHSVLCILCTVYTVQYISYRVRRLYRLGKTCYLHSLLCNDSIICIVYYAIIVLKHSLLCKMILFQFAHGKMITQPTLTPPQRRDWWCAIICAEIVSRLRDVTKQLWEYWHTNMPRNGNDTSNELISGLCSNHFYLVANIVT